MELVKAHRADKLRCHHEVKITIDKLEIKNFKSIQDLKLDCKRVNLFIGEPNTGKSNILEAIGLLSYSYYGMAEEIRHFVRFKNTRDFYYDHILENSVRIGFDENALEITFKDGRFTVNYIEDEKRPSELFSISHEGSTSWLTTASTLSQFKFYRFAMMEHFPDQRSEFLRPSNGNNLLAVILTRRELRATIKTMFESFGLRLVFEPHEGRVVVQKQLEDIIIAFPYSLSSETLQRLVFYLTAIRSNQLSILAFEEPEAHAFPYYTKYLGEIIGLNKNRNQYFISTHNPYFLFSILEKTPKDEVAVFCTYLKDYQTKVKLLSEDEKKDTLEMGADAFFDLDRFLG